MILPTVLQAARRRGEGQVWGSGGREMAALDLAPSFLKAAQLLQGSLGVDEQAEDLVTLRGQRWATRNPYYNRFMTQEELSCT